MLAWNSGKCQSERLDWMLGDGLILRFSKSNAAASRSSMKYLAALAILLALNSCNTCIGLGRDIKQGYEWTQGKVQGTGNGGGGDVAPVY
jgi:predicted small secreted protein